MKLQLFITGKTTQDFIKCGIAEYCGRLKHYLSFEVQVLPSIKNARNLLPKQVKEKEGDAILKAIQPNDYLILLDEHGCEMTSLLFAEYLEQKIRTVAKSLVFVIGGSFGFSPKVLKTAKETISLSRMTFSHQLVRLVFVEQLYRAMTILHGEPYHHE